MISNREVKLMTFGQPVVCPSCGKTSYIYPKAVGHQPYIWEINCKQCHLFNLGLNGYLSKHKEVVNKLDQLRERYINGTSTPELKKDILELSKLYDPILDNRKCECSGYLSISAKPRCIYCDVVIFDSYFHYSNGDKK